MPNVFYKEKYMLDYENFQLYLGLGLKLKKTHQVLEFNQSQWLHRKIKAEKSGDKDGKVLYKLMNDAVYGKRMGNLE